MINMTVQFTGGPDYSSQPLLPPWYTIGWTAQAPFFLTAPSSPFAPIPFPSDQVFVETTGMYFDADRNPLSGYLTFQQGDNITVTEGGVTYRVPARLTGLIPPGAYYGYAFRGSGRISLYYGRLDVVLMATDNPNVVTDSGSPLVYHVKEYFMGGRNFDIRVPMASDSPVDISDLIVAGTTSPNKDWSLGY
jgi:hypothetical protein